MHLFYDPPAANEPVKFKLQGFPEEEGVKLAVEKFYAEQAGADRRFVVNNMFGEMIFSGSADAGGVIAELKNHERPRENFKKPTI